MNIDYLNICNFNYSIYRQNEDLKTLTNLQLAEHFLTHGIVEGRIYNAIKTRKDFVDLIDESKGEVLEIGPLDNPQLNYQSPDYYSLDVFSKDQLIQNYIGDSKVIPEKIIEPSYVIKNNDYSQIQQKFNCIFSSHNIEHMPSVVAFLNNLESVLADDGTVYLIVPDKRYCFDHFKKETDIYEVLQAHYDNNAQPKLADVLKMVSAGTHNNSVAHWNNDHGAIEAETALLQNYQGILNQYNTGVYIDAHVSFFTPHSFMNIMNILNKLKLVRLKIHKLFHTLSGSNEFYVILNRA